MRAGVPPVIDGCPICTDAFVLSTHRIKLNVPPKIDDVHGSMPPRHSRTAVLLEELSKACVDVVSAVVPPVIASHGIETCSFCPYSGYLKCVNGGPSHKSASENRLHKPRHRGQSRRP